MAVQFRRRYQLLEVVISLLLHEFLRGKVRRQWRGLVARYGIKYVNVNVEKLCCLWVTSPLWAHCMLSYDVCTHVRTGREKW